MNENQRVAWAVGLFEGEGCIYMTDKAGRSGSQRQCRLVLSMTDEDAVRRFHEIVEVGTVRENRYFQRKYGYQIQYQWGAGKRSEVRSLLVKMLPMLCGRRAKKATQALKFLDDLDG